DGLRRLAGVEGDGSGLGDVVVVTRLGGAVRRLEQYRHGLVIGRRERDREREQRRLAPLALVFGHAAEADPRLVVHGGAGGLTLVDGRVGRTAQVHEEGLVLFGDAVTFDQYGDGLAGLAGSEGQPVAGGLVVAAGGRRAVARGVHHGHREVVGGG